MNTTKPVFIDSNLHNILSHSDSLNFRNQSVEPQSSVEPIRPEHKAFLQHLQNHSAENTVKYKKQFIETESM